MEYQLRQKLQEDDQFVLKLFSEHKVKELNAELWPDEMKLQVCKMQYFAFEKSLFNQYCNLEDYIITIASERIGRIILNKTKTEVSMPYFALLTIYQHKGIGRTMLNKLIQQARSSNRIFSLQVSKENPAFKLYSSIGFVVSYEDDLKFSMIFKPS